MTTLPELSRRVSEAEGPSREWCDDCDQDCIGLDYAWCFSYDPDRGPCPFLHPDETAALLAIHERNKSDE